MIARPFHSATGRRSRPERKEARRAGIDFSLLDSSLALTYEERVLRHASAQELMQALKEA